jgi:predicted enzyme related to lactoylglutathione lyase
MSENHGKVCWNELNTRDAKGACDFYAATCGWTYDRMPLDGGTGDYFVAMRDGVPTAGILNITTIPGMEQVRPHWFTYFAVDDVDTSAKASEAAGARVQRAPWDIPGVGRIAIIQDPTGATLGLMTPADHDA